MAFDSLGQFLKFVLGFLLSQFFSKDKQKTKPQSHKISTDMFLISS